MFFVIKENPKNFACHLFSAGKTWRSTPALDLTKKVDTDVFILSQVSCAAVLFFLSKGRYDELVDQSCIRTTVRGDKRGEANLYGPDRVVKSIFENSRGDCVTHMYQYEDKHWFQPFSWCGLAGSVLVHVGLTCASVLFEAGVVKCCTLVCRRICNLVCCFAVRTCILKSTCAVTAPLCYVYVWMYTNVSWCWLCDLLDCTGGSFIFWF